MILLAASLIEQEPFFRVDMSINLTTILGFVVWVVTIAIAWTKIGGRLDMVEYRMEAMEKNLIRITAALELFGKNDKDLALVKQQVVVLESNYAALNDRIDRLSRGEGWTQARRANVDGEYSRTT